MTGTVNFELSADTLDRFADEIALRVEARLGRRDVTRDDRWMPTPEAAEYLGISTNALHKLTSARQIEFSQDGSGGRCYFKKSDLDAHREQGRVRALVLSD